MNPKPMELPPFTPRVLDLFLPVLPQPQQSVRFSSAGGFIRKYQPKKVVDWKKKVGILVRAQLPQGFKPFTREDCLRLHVNFIYPPQTSFRKWEIELLQSGGMIRKNTRPDRQDNLMKALCDALSGIVWEDDSIITDGPSGAKYFGLKEGIEIRIETVAKYEPMPF